MNKLWMIVALVALALSIFSLLTPPPSAAPDIVTPVQETVTERVIIIEKEVRSALSAPSPPYLSPTPIITLPRWVESDAYRQWKNSVKTEEKYLPSHFGLGQGSPSGYWNER